MTTQFDPVVRIALGKLVATLWTERDISDQFATVNAGEAWDGTNATDSKRLRARDALQTLANQGDADAIQGILLAAIRRSTKGNSERRGSTGLTEGEAYAGVVEALSRQGFQILDDGSLVALGLSEVAAKEQVGHFESLLKKQNFDVSHNHFRQAMSALSRGDCEAANGQTRAFLDALCEQLAGRLFRGAGDKPTGGPARKYLQDSGFLTEADGNLLFALFKVLHGEGSHPGTSDRHDAARRLLMASALGSYYVEHLVAREEAQRADLMALDILAAEVLGKPASTSVLLEYQSLDFDTLTIEDADVVLETVRQYYRDDPLGEAWFSEFEDAMQRGCMEWSLVVTERRVAPDLRWLEEITDGIYVRSSSTVVVEVKLDERAKALSRISRGRDVLSDRIVKARERDRLAK